MISRVDTAGGAAEEPARGNQRLVSVSVSFVGGRDRSTGVGWVGVPSKDRHRTRPNVPGQTSKACEVQASVGSNPTATANWQDCGRRLSGVLQPAVTWAGRGQTCARISAM